MYLWYIFEDILYMYKTWNQQYSFINNGDQVEESIHSKYTDNDSVYQKGYKKKNNKDNSNEQFYKLKSNQNNKKKMLGKSNNQSDWTILKDNNGKQVISEQSYDDFTYESQFKNNLKHASLHNNNFNSNTQLKDLISENQSDNILGFFNSKQGFGNFFDIKHIDEFNYDDMFDDEFFFNKN